MTIVESIKHFFLSAGAAWVLWLLAALSVLSLAVALERFFFYRKREGGLRELAERLHVRLSAGELEQAAAELGAAGTVPALVAQAGLRLAHLGPVAVEKAMQSRLAFEREALDARLSYLGTLGNNAPFIGLFGTVIGVIQAFEELGHGVVGHAAGGSGASHAASQAVMGAIAEALVATAVGIAVALPAVAAYNYFQRRVATMLGSSEVLSNLVLAYLTRSDDGGGRQLTTSDTAKGAV